MSLKSIFSGVRGIRSGSSSRRFLGVERRVTPSLIGELSFGGVRTVEWNEEFRFNSMSGDHVTGSLLRPGNTIILKSTHVFFPMYYVLRPPKNIASYLFMSFIQQYNNTSTK